jgi:hypothetical protein
MRTSDPLAAVLHEHVEAAAAPLDRDRQLANLTVAVRVEHDDAELR